MASELKYGDRINVAEMIGSIRPDEVRTFLAEADGWVMYKNSSTRDRPFIATADRVSRYVEPYPFKVGDRIRLSVPLLNPTMVYTVMRVAPKGSVFLAYWSGFEVRSGHTTVSEAHRWELADA